MKMKRIVALVMASVMVFSLSACSQETGGAQSAADSGQEAQPAAGAEDDVQSEADAGESAEPKEVGHFKIGTIDMGSADATSAPLLNQLRTTVEAMGCEYVTATASEMSAEAYLAAYQNLIAAGCDGVITSYGQVSADAMAQMFDEAGVLWSTYWYHFVEGTDEYEAVMNSETFVSSTYEDDVNSAYWAAAELGKKGCKKLCMVGLPAGGATANMRDEGIKKACEEYGMEILAEERDFSLTITSAGGATITERFLTAYPECDGILIAGMTQFVLAGVVQTLEQAGKVGTIPVSGIDFNEYQFDYFEKGALNSIIGGHFCGPTYSAILMINQLNGTPLTSDKVQIENMFIELNDSEEVQKYADWLESSGTIYSADEISTCLVANNPDFTYDALIEMADAYCLEDLLARHGN